MGHEGQAALLVRIDIRGSLDATVPGMNALRGGGEITVWRTREATRVPLSKSLQLHMGNWTSSFVPEARHWERNPSCGRVEIRPTAHLNGT